MATVATVAMAIWQSGDTQRAVIPTTVATIITMRKKGQGDAAEEGEIIEVEPSHKVTKFLWAAVNSGEYVDIDKHVADELKITLNGEPVGENDPGLTGLEALQATIESWRTLMPDLHWALLDEVHDKDRLALRFQVTGTPSVDGEAGWSGETLRYQVAAFLHLDHKRVHSAHQFIDLQQIDEALEGRSGG